MQCVECQHDEELHVENGKQCVAVYRDESFCTCPNFISKRPKYPPVLGWYHD